MIERASKTNKSQGRTTDDKQSFLLASLAASADSPEQTICSRPSKIARIKSMGVPRSTGYRYLNIATKQRMEIRNGTINVPWSSVEKRKGYSKVSPKLRKRLFEWINNHPHIVNSPISNDTLLVPDPEQPGNRVRVSKLLLQISIRELHNDLLSDGPLGLAEAKDNDGKPLISDTALRALLPPNVRKMTEKYKQMCGWEPCISMTQLQNVAK